MITNKTQDHINNLVQAMRDAADGLRQTFSLMSMEADAQLAAAAQTFLALYTEPNCCLLDPRYTTARAGLAHAATRAVTMKDLAERAESADSKARWWLTVKNGDYAQATRLVASDAEFGQKPLALQSRLDRLANHGWPGAYWIRQHYSELPVDHFVAANSYGLVAQGTKAQDVTAKLAELQVNPDDVTLVFIQASGPLLLEK